VELLLVRHALLVPADAADGADDRHGTVDAAHLRQTGSRSDSCSADDGHVTIDDEPGVMMGS
jgi:hypothetical protein